MRIFHEQMQELQQKLLRMGGLAEAMLGLALKTLLERDEKYVAEVKASELEVDRLQMEIDEDAIKLTALQQPVASDVRFLFMASRIASELERIADKAITICESAQRVLEGAPLKVLADFPLMAKAAQKMVRDALEALNTRDCALAQSVLDQEQTVNNFRDRIFNVLMTSMMSDPSAIPRAFAMILISRNIERTGDHATNIAEEVIYLVNARDVRHLEAQNLKA
jgi:phosphate transport system protein